MNIKIIASSSKGCCYCIESDGYQLLIECGIPIDQIKRAFDFNFLNLVGCLVSHEHGDHAAYINQLYNQTWIDVWCTRSTKQKYNVAGANVLEHKFAIYPSDKFSVLPILLNHDVECFGFFIQRKRNKLFYVSDTFSINYIFPGLTHLMIETNYCFEKIMVSERNKASLKRAFENHLSIDSAIEFIQKHPTLQEIHLLHLSNDHADIDLFRDKVRNVTGIPIYIPSQN